MKAYRLAAITVSLSWIWFSCQTYEITLDNPIDEIAHADSGYFSPALTMFPLIQTVEVGNSITIGSYIVDHDTAITSLAGVHMRVTYDGGLLKLDTILPGVLFTNNGANTPLFTHNTSGGDMIDIFVWYLGDEGALSYVTETGHIAEIYFTARSTGETTVEYDSTQCELVTPLNESISIRGIRNATVTIQ